MDVSMLLDSIVLSAKAAKADFASGNQIAAIKRLDDVLQSINLVKKVSGADFRDSDEFLGIIDHPMLSLPEANDDFDDSDGSELGNRVEFTAEEIEKLDEVFFSYLARLCTDSQARDAEGQKIHNTLTAKKLGKATEETSFRQLKFRIQAFKNAFVQELEKNGYSEISNFQIRKYLYHQRYIARYTKESKNFKSKGAVVWIVEAKKTSDGGWIFREFEPCFVDESEFNVKYGEYFTFRPKIYDPQSKKPKAVITFLWLPDWLVWDNGILKGTPSLDAESCSFTIQARVFNGGFSESTIEKQIYINIQ